MQGSLRTRLWITVVATATLCLAALAGGGPSAAAAPAAKPGIITSAGQSSDAVMVNVLANTQLKLGLDFDPLVQAESLAGYRTLVWWSARAPRGWARPASTRSRRWRG